MIRNRVLSRLLPVKAQAIDFETTLVFPSVENSLALSSLSSRQAERNHARSSLPGFLQPLAFALFPRYLAAGGVRGSAAPPNFDDS